LVTLEVRKVTCLFLAGLMAWGAAPALAQGPKPDPERPLSSMVALVQRNLRSIPVQVRRYVDQFAKGTLPANVVFPLPNSTSDSVRAISNVGHNVVAKWLDPLTPNTSGAAPRYGANNDYIAYFGDGWNADWPGGEIVGSPPQFHGSGRAAWIWSNHEYISNARPTASSAPTGQHLTFAKFLKDAGLLTNDVTASTWAQADLDAYTRQYKRQLGGSWFRVELNTATKQWRLVPRNDAVRYDATSSTLVSIVGHRPRLDKDDSGVFLPRGVTPGIIGDCSGAQTPWGTVISAEENVQDYYGDLETAWTSAQRFVPGTGFDPGSFITPTLTSASSGEFGQISSPLERHNRDAYGYAIEIDPGLPGEVFYLSTNQFGGDGFGHRKIGSLGRARWENAAFAVGADFKLIPNQPIVLYAGDDRRSGRIYKWISQGSYVAGMSRSEVRAMLDEGSLWVAHFAGLENTTGLTLKATGASPTESAPGTGQWIYLTTSSADIAPNAAALGRPNITVGEALRDVNWNGIGGFRNDNDVRTALFTASNKIGVMELNRPEDIEWNPRDPSGRARLYVAFTNHNRQVALNQDGVLFPPSEHAANSPLRPDPTGAVFAMEEANPANPAASTTFKYFAVWVGTRAAGLFDAADPDNIMIDSQGGVWFGTDGNRGTNGTADAIYYLDLDPKHREGAPGVTTPTFGRAFRIAAVPSDAEATGPAFSSDEATIFLNVQHPGEELPSTWPQSR
jgi:secreted PhoX family phosphatase